MDSKTFADKVCQILKDHKGQDIVSIDVKGKSDVADYYVVAGGRSTTHVKALIDHVEAEIDKEDIAPVRREGIREGRWAVLDYGDVIVHVFNDESRLFYHLESLWDDGKNTVKY